MLKLQPKLFTGSFINLAQHLLNYLLVSCKLFWKELVSYIIDSRSWILSITLWLFILLCWCLNFELIISWYWYDTGVLLEENTKINVVVLNVIVVPKRGKETRCPWLTDVGMDGEHLLANIKRHDFVLLDYVQGLLYLGILKLATEDRCIQLEVTEFPGLDVEGNTLLLVLAHDLMEDLSVYIKLAPLFIYEWTRK